MAAPEIRLRDPDALFVWSPPPGGGGRLSAEQLAQFDRDGYVLVEQAFDPAEIAAVIEAIDPYERRGEEFLRSQPDGRLFIARADEITFTINLALRSDTLRRFSHHPAFVELCADVIGPDARLYWEQSVYKKPGNQAEFPFHQDNGYTAVEPQQYLTCWVALTDTDESNGCPWVMPGMHRHGTLAHELTEFGWRCLDSEDGAIAVPARAGDIVVFSSLTPHRTGPNLTDATRKSYIVQFAPDGVVKFVDGVAEPQQDPDRQYFVLRNGVATGAGTRP